MIAYIIRYPEVQSRMQEELDRVVGSERLVSLSDKIDLPFVNATIMVVSALIISLIYGHLRRPNVLLIFYHKIYLDERLGM